MFVDSNLTKNLKELKDSCRQQSEELNDLLIQRDQLQKERTINGERKDALVNDNTQERRSPAAPSGARDPTKRPKKDEADLGFEDEVLQIEDLEPPGVSASKVLLSSSSGCCEDFWGGDGAVVLWGGDGSSASCSDQEEKSLYEVA